MTERPIRDRATRCRSCGSRPTSTCRTATPAPPGDFEPDPHRQGVREGGRPARQHPPRALVDGAGRAGATEAAGGDPRALKRLEVQFRGMGFPSRRSSSRGRSARSTAHRVAVEVIAEQSGNAIIRNAEAELELTS